MSRNQYRDDSEAHQRAEILAGWVSPSAKPGMVRVGDEGNTSQQLITRENAERARKYLPTLPKTIAAWLSVGLGAFGLLAAALPPQGGVSWPQNIAMGLSMAVLAGLPGVYWLMCNRRDRLRVERFLKADASYREQLSMMTEEDRRLLSEPEEWPHIPKRHWAVVWTVAAIALVVFVLVSPDAATTV